MRPPELREVDVDKRLGPGDGDLLRALARAAISDRLHGDESLAKLEASLDLTPALRAPRGAFVTLRSRGELRGCVGTIVSEEPLYRTVTRHAIHAAFDDPRFPPLRADELEGLAVEVSALTPLVDVGGPDEIVPGRDGVHLEYHGSRAVFLPKVAVEQGWGTRELLENLALKANLPRDAWREAVLKVFRAEVFADETRSG